jgi:hypothetical protein
MSHTFQVYPRPEGTNNVVTSDDGFTGTMMPNTDPSSGRAGQVITIPDSVVSEHGCTIETTKEGYLPRRNRGFLLLREDGIARFQLDDWELDPVPSAPPPGGGGTPSGSTPKEVIDSVYATGKYSLLTKESCGLFVEECTTIIHETIVETAGHIRKEPGQNQFNGHAVDAFMILSGEWNGIWDIIVSSASSDAKPAWNRAGDIEPEKWYYPAAPIGAAGTIQSAEKAIKTEVLLSDKPAR